jgi:ribosomal protein L7/L12
MIAALDLTDYGIIFVIVGLASSVYAVLKPADVSRLRRLEKKLDLLLKNFGIDAQVSAGLSQEVCDLADDPAKKISAIALHRQQTGLGLKEAKDAVEAYIDQRTR